MISAIGHFLAELPNARVLYRDHVWPEEDLAEENLWKEAEAEEESFIAIIGLICHYEKLKCENLRPWKLKIQT